MTGCTHFHCPAAVCDLTTAPSTSLCVFYWVPTYTSLTSALAERLLTPEDCMVCHAEGGNGRSARQHSLNDLVWRAMAKADIPALKEPSGLLRTDGKRPDGVILLPLKQGKCVTWDVTVSDTLAESCVHETLRTPGAAAEAAAERKRNKYSTLSQS